MVALLKEQREGRGARGPHQGEGVQKEHGKKAEATRQGKRLKVHRHIDREQKREELVCFNRGEVQKKPIARDEKNLYLKYLVPRR